MAFVVRTHHDPARVVPFIRSAIAAADPLQPISDLVTMDAHLARALSRPRFMSTLIAAFGILALSLSVVGVYGVMAYAVTQRTREIAIRMALGAHSRTIVAMVLSRTMRLVAIGLVGGIAGAAVFALYAVGSPVWPRGVRYDDVCGVGGAPCRGRACGRCDPCVSRNAYRCSGRPETLTSPRNAGIPLQRFTSAASGNPESPFTRLKRTDDTTASLSRRFAKSLARRSLRISRRSLSSQKTPR